MPPTATKPWCPAHPPARTTGPPPCWSAHTPVANQHSHHTKSQTYYSLTAASRTRHKSCFVIGLVLNTHQHGEVASPGPSRRREPLTLLDDLHDSGGLAGAGGSEEHIGDGARLACHHAEHRLPLAVVVSHIPIEESADHSFRKGSITILTRSAKCAADACHRTRVEPAESQAY
eukprot:1194166-Prorocentrum_minimum.AAC.2